MREPKVSIIIPAYNRGDLIGETLDSVLAQTYPHWECIVVDDHSTDNTWEVVERYCNQDSRFKLFRRPEERPKGANACRNYGFEKSVGEYIQWFDSDDIMKEGFLGEKVKAFLISGADVVIAIGEWLFPSGNIELLPKFKSNQPENFYLEYIKGTYKFGTPGPMFKRSIIEKAGLFNEHLLKYQDPEYFPKPFLLAKKIELIEKSLFQIRIHGNRISGSMSDHLKELEHFKYRISLFKYLEEKNRLSPDLQVHLLNEVLRSYVVLRNYNAEKAKRIRSFIFRNKPRDVSKLMLFLKWSIGFAIYRWTGKGYYRLLKFKSR